MDTVFDVAIIGGGINGCGCAADASLRGLSVVLLEQDDLASKTSSSSTKLIHGGLRYLEHYEFSLVKKALDERQNLLNLAPYLVHPQSFLLPYEKHMRPAWFLRLGLFLYDHLSFKNKLPKCKSVTNNNNPNLFKPLLDVFKRGFIFYDAATDDARLTITNALQAKQNGASIRPHSKVIHTQIINGLWELQIQPKHGEAYTLKTKALINAAGPWVKIISDMTEINSNKEITLVKGSHILVPKLYDGDHAYFLQHQDKRVVFVIPYHGHSMIGTTDVPFKNDPSSVTISDEEISYLTGLVNSYFKTQLTKKDVTYSWSGVRPLLASAGKDLKTLSRDYSYVFALKPAPIVTIYGGKITTYRQLAEEIINQLASLFPNMPQSKTSSTPLPGTLLESMTFNDYATYAKNKYQWMDEELLERYLHTYGTRMELFLNQCSSIKSLGKKFSKSLYQIEVDYLVLEEWATSCDDVLTRRTKLILEIDKSGLNKLEEYLQTLTTYPVPTEPVFH